jgi:hypothetical protein
MIQSNTIGTLIQSQNVSMVFSQGAAALPTTLSALPADLSAFGYVSLSILTGGLLTVNVTSLKRNGP